MFSCRDAVLFCGNQTWLAEKSTKFFMVKSERDIRKFTSSYSFNRLVVLMKNNSDFPTFSIQSRCTKKAKTGKNVAAQVRQFQNVSCSTLD
jgi:hypothetical protein